MTGVDAAEPAVAGTGPVWSSSELTRPGEGNVIRLESWLHRTQVVTWTRDLLSPDNPLLHDCVGSRRALVVLSPSVNELYGRQVRAYFTARQNPAGVELTVLRRCEASKSLDAVVEVCERAAAAGLCRTSPIVAIGGGVCSDICGLAAALHRRGIPHINVPTTLVGLIDAGIGTKNAVNHGGRKSALGSFHPPEHSLLDAGFLASLPQRHVRSGLAECIKLAVVSSDELFTVLEDHATALVESALATPASAGERVIRLSVTGMLTELARNLFEDTDFRRPVDFGHTFSPYIEVASGHAILHGEAVALDIALSSHVAADLGLLQYGELERVLSVIEAVGLSLAWPQLSISGLWSALSSVVEHRDGDLHLVVPTGIGTCDYLGMESISPRLLQSCLDRLVRRSRTAPARPHVVSDSVSV